jgi:hypothetical protein
MPKKLVLLLTKKNQKLYKFDLVKKNNTYFESLLIYQSQKNYIKINST